MRTTSGVTNMDFPFTDDRVPFILIVAENPSETKDGRGFEHASTLDKKRALLVTAKEFEDRGYRPVVLATWPGTDRTDVFHVDDLDVALAAFG